VLILAAVVAVFGALAEHPVTDSEVGGLVAVVLAVLGFMSSAGWLAYVISGVVVRRTGSAAVLLATRRIRADHGAAGRAAAAAGAVGLTLGVLGVFVTDVVRSDGVDDPGYYVGPAVLVGIIAILVLGLIALSLTLHSIETTLERRREMSALVATGIPEATIAAANRIECVLVTLPVTLVAATLGALVVWLGPARGGAQALGGLVAVVFSAGAVLVAAWVASESARPWLRTAVEAGNLRTE
jgi:hypothetical protein